METIYRDSSGYTYMYKFPSMVHDGSDINMKGQK